MVDGIFTTAEVVEEYGTDKCKEYFANNKKLGGHKDSLHKTLDEFYDTWEIVKVSRSNCYKLGEKRQHRLERKDNRINNGNREQLPYKEDIRTALIQYLYKHQNDNRATITTKRLAYELGCFSEIMYEASKKIGTDERQDYFEEVCERDSRIKNMGWDVFYECVKEVERLKNQVETVLDELKENNIIYYADIYQAVIETDDGQKNYDKVLTIDEIIAVKHQQMKLRQKHMVTHQDIMFKLKSESVKAYKRDERAYFLYMGFSRVFQTKVITLIAYDKEIEDYFSRTPLTDAFRFKHINFAVKLAEKRQDAFHNKTVVIRNNNQLHKVLGGKKKSDIYKETDTACDKIVGNNGIRELLDNEIIQLKMSNCYAEAIDKGLKVLQIEEEKETEKSA
ncbi:hypothetical protein [Peribacillus butanolivorans]|uniref:hypothetical protein n=1 Tax=Peribacillus butanolivorans TaxID=421767 RepID=UPI000A4146FC|nr:hypothetical protein [Peribacillus butanolivorans]